MTCGFITIDCLSSFFLKGFIVQVLHSSKLKLFHPFTLSSLNTVGYLQKSVNLKKKIQLSDGLLAKGWFCDNIVETTLILQWTKEPASGVEILRKISQSPPLAFLKKNLLYKAVVQKRRCTKDNIDIILRKFGKKV